MSNQETTILLAEDDIILAELYTERLKQEGYKVVHCADGEDALNQIMTIKPNLVILDIMMPKMNGLDVLKAVKENPSTQNIPIIIVTALVQEIEKINKMLNKADAYLVKSEVLPAQIIEEVKEKLAMVQG